MSIIKNDSKCSIDGCDGFGVWGFIDYEKGDYTYYCINHYDNEVGKKHMKVISEQMKKGMHI